MRWEGAQAAVLVALLQFAFSATATAQSDDERSKAVTTKPLVSSLEGRAENVCLVAGTVTLEKGGVLVVDGFGCDWQLPLGLGPDDPIDVRTHADATGLTLESRECSLVSAGRWACGSQGIPREAEQQLSLGVRFSYGGSNWTFDVGPPFAERLRAIVYTPRGCRAVAAGRAGSASWADRRRARTAGRPSSGRLAARASTSRYA